MEQIENLVRLIVFTVILWAFIEMLLPNGAFKKYTRFIGGLVVISVFITPVMELRHAEFLPPELAEEQTYSYEGTNALIKKVYKARLERQIEEVFDVGQVEVLLDDQLQITDVVTEDPDMKKRIMRYIQYELQ